MTEPYSKQAVSVQRVTEEARSSFESNSMRVGYAMGDLERDANGKYVYLGMEASFDSYLMGWIARGKQEGAQYFVVEWSFSGKNEWSPVTRPPYQSRKRAERYPQLPGFDYRIVELVPAAPTETGKR